MPWITCSLSCEESRLKGKNEWSWVLVTHTSNRSSLGGRDQEDCGSKPTWAKSYGTLSQQKWAWWHIPIVPATAESINRRIRIPGQSRIKARHYLKNNQRKIGWRHGSSNAACLPKYAKAWVQTPVLPKNKRMSIKRELSGDGNQWEERRQNESTRGKWT
jgi:hypothetical protein